MEVSPHTVTTFLTIDEAITFLGEFRQFQWLLDASFCFMSIPRVFQVLLMYFAALDSPWKCVSNSSICLLNGTLLSTNRERCSMGRSEWEYTMPKEFSMTTEFDLQCENEWIIYLLTSIVFIGWAVGAIVLGWVADNYGRKVVIYPSQAVIIIVGFLCSFSHNISLIMLCRFIIGFFIPGATVQSFVLVSEYVGTKCRPLAGLIIFISFDVALCLLAFLAYGIKTWKVLSIVCTAPFITSLVTYFFVPESVRWLRLKRGKSELMSTFNRIAYWNKRELPDTLTILPAAVEVMHELSSPLDIFRPRHVAFLSLIQGYSWLVNGMVFYGLVLAARDLGGSLYLNFLLLAVVGIPGNILAIDLCERIGRKKTVIISMFIASLFCIIVAFIPKEEVTGRIIRVCFGMIGKLSIGISFSAIYVWSLEMYPTTIRANGMGFLQVTSRVGAAAAPWVAKGLLPLSQAAPFVVMGLSSLLATILLTFVTETRNTPTMETVEDMHRKQSALLQQSSII